MQQFKNTTDKKVKIVQETFTQLQEKGVVPCLPWLY